MKELAFIEELVKDAGEKLRVKKVESLEMQFSEEAKYSEKKNKLPEFNPIYKDSIMEHNRIAIHSKLGVFPFEVLRSKAPNQTDAEWNYQLGLYESYTNSVWNRAKNKTKIISNKQNYSITGFEDEQKDYFYDDYPVYHSIEAFFWDVVRDRKIDFPNQVLVIEPMDIAGEYEDEQEGVKKFIPDQSLIIDPVAKILEEKNIVQFKENEYCLVLLDKRCEYVVDNKIRKDGYMFKFYDKQAIWEINQTGFDKKGFPVFEVPRMVYLHNWDCMPARKLGGKIAKDVDGNILFNSVYVDAVPDLNAVIRLSSNRDMANYKMAFPVIIALVDDCNFTDENGASCQNGKVLGEKGYVECPSCKGSGTKSNHSPTGVYEVRATKGYNETNNLAMSPPVQFAAPDIAILDYLSKQIEEKKESAFSFIFETNNAKSNTATGVALEKEEFHSFLIHFSNEMFDLLEFTIEAMGWYRYGEKFKMPQITRPIAFNFRTNKDITTEISDAVTSKMPSPYIAGLFEEADETRFNNNDVQRKRTQFAKRADRIFYMDPLTVSSGVGQGRISKTVAIIHDSINTFMLNAEAEHENFWDMDFNEQYNIILQYAQAEEAKMQPANRANNILNNANEDTNSEAA